MRRRSNRKPLSMTSLIDVIFLLLLFFMLSSTFSKYSEVELSAAQPGAASAAPAADALRVTLDSDQIRLGGAAVSDEQLAAEVRAALQGRDRVVILTVDQASRAQRLTDALLILRRIEGAQIHVVRQP